MAEPKVTILIGAKDVEKTRAALKSVGVSVGNLAAPVKQATVATNLFNTAMRYLSVTLLLYTAMRLFKNIANEAIEFESAFAGVRKTVDATESEFKKMRQGLIDLSTQIPVTAVNLAKIEEIAGQLGIRGTKNLTNFTKAIAKITASTNLTQEAAATDFARIASVIGEPIDNIEKMASSVVDLGNKFEVQEDEILAFANRIAGMGKITRLTSADIFAIGAAFSSVGVQAQAGGTAVNRIMLDMQKEGKTGAEAFQGFMNKLRDAGEDAGILLDEMGIKEARAQRAFLSLAGAGNKLERALRISNEAFVEGNALQIEAEKRFQTTASQIQIMKNNLSALSIELGETFLPALNDVVKGLGKFFEVLTKGVSIFNRFKKALGDPKVLLQEGVALAAKAVFGDIETSSEESGSIVANNLGDLPAQKVETAWDRVLGSFKYNEEEKKKVISNSAAVMTASLEDSFFSIVEGRFQDLSESVANFGKAMLQIVAHEAFSRLVGMGFDAVGTAFGSIGKSSAPAGASFQPAPNTSYTFSHSGGTVPRRAHSGTTIGDGEVPMLLQSGEQVLNRGEAASYRMGKNGQSGGTVINLVQNIQTYDTKDFIRNSPAIAQAFISELKKNSKVRGAIISYV